MLHSSRLAIGVFLFIPALAFAHGGGLDADGCHMDYTHGEYHCHRGPRRDQPFDSRAQMLDGVANKPSPLSAADPAAYRTVTRVVDGDTLVLDGSQTIRLIGVDTPETVHPDKPVERFGKEAAAFTTRMAAGQRVWLKLDPGNKAIGHTDRYGRTLAYVYLPDGLLLNREIIRQGYGHVYAGYPFLYRDDFRAAERAAREQRRGLWE